MEALRKTLVDAEHNPPSGIDLGRLIVEWNALTRPELKGWFLLQIMASLNKSYIDVDVFLSLTLANVKDWNQFPLVGIALRCGANPNIYFKVPGLGAPHALIYAVDKARSNGLALDATDALCIMLIAHKAKEGRGAQLSSLAFSEGSSVAIDKPPEPNTNYDQSLVILANMPQAQAAVNLERRTVGMELARRGIRPLDDYMAVLKDMNNYIPAIVGTCIDDKDIAFLVDGHIPEFEYLISCQADKLFLDYPNITPAKHTYIISGEIAGMRQSIEGGCFQGFLTFIKSGVIPTYFTLNRLCYYLCQAYTIEDKAFFLVLINMLNICIGIGCSLDSHQYSMLQVATIKTGKSPLGDMTAFIQEAYKEPKWHRACKAPSSAEVPSYLRQLAFNLGIDPNQTRDGLCNDLKNLDRVDATKIREAARAKQSRIISGTVANVSDFVGTTPATQPNTVCTNTLSGGIIPEDYNDVLMSFYKDDNKIYCFTSANYEDILRTQKTPFSDKLLDPTYLSQIQAKLTMIQRLGLDPRNPTPVYQAAAKLREPETFPPVDDNFATNSIIKMLQTRNLVPVAVSNSTPEDLNAILQSINMYQDLLPKFEFSHQITTFYEAAYYYLRRNPSQVGFFLDSYQVKGALVLKPEEVKSFNTPTPPTQPFVTYPSTFTTNPIPQTSDIKIPPPPSSSQLPPQTVVNVPPQTVITVPQNATQAGNVVGVPTTYTPLPSVNAQPINNVYYPNAIPSYQVAPTSYTGGIPSNITFTSQEDPRIVALERDFLARKAQIEHENLVRGYIPYASVASNSVLPAP